MATLLVDLMVDRVDLVEEGSCSVADIKLFKNKGGKPAMEFAQILEQLKPEHRAVVEAEVAKAKAEATAAMEEELNKAKCDLEESMTKASELEATNEELAKENEELKAANESKDGEEETVEKSNRDMEEVIKGLDPTVQAYLANLKAQKDAAEQVAKSAAAEKAKEQAIAKARELKALPVEETQLVSVIEKGMPEEIYDILKSAAKLCEESELFKSKGSDAEGNTEDAWAKIEAKASEIAKARNISREKAVGAVIKEFPEMYTEYLNNGAN